MGENMAAAAKSTEVLSQFGQTVIEGKNVTKVFGETVTALEGANFDIQAGEFISLVGPSGCGKSTLLRLVAGLIEKTTGDVRVNDELVTKPRTDIGMMFQKAVLLDWRTAIENVLLPSEMKHRITQQDKQKAMASLELVGLKGFEFHFPKQLSGGMQQRVALARLIQTGADIMLMDEPFGALDEFTRERLNVELMRIVGELKATTLFVTHNIQEAIYLADRVMVMTPRPGRIAEIIEVNFERPRDISIQTSREFNIIIEQVRDTLGSH
jgi:NitT/TauT family transport system ATP-binding protein